MKMKRVFTLFYSLAILLSLNVFAQPEWEAGMYIEDSIHSNKVRTCMLTPFESLLEFPVIALGSGQALRLQFDDLDFNAQDYMYSLRHCNANWSVSDLHPSEYLDGFYQNFINNYEFSFNTKQSYVHYELNFPNGDFTFTKSGNYIITVYNPDANDEVLFTKRFMVYNEQLLVGAEVKQATFASGRFTEHEIDLMVNFTNVDYVNPIQDVTIAIYQGHRWDNVITDLQPSFVEKKKLIYDFDYESSFKAGNEYRFFDTKSVRFFTERVQNIIHDSTDIVLLHPDYPWGNQAYSFYQDIEGYYVPNIMERTNNNTEADYVWVNFCLKQKPFVDNGAVYIYGALTNWSIEKSAKLNYNEEAECYETSLLLKQGYYNYTYLFVPEESQTPNQSQVDGDYYQTSQDYYVFVYLYDYDYGYDRLLGLRRVSSKGMF